MKVRLPLKIKSTSALIIYLLLFIAFNSKAQVWSPIAGLPSAANFKTVKFIDANTGWVAGDDGAILKTTDGGNNWVVQTSGTANTLRSIFFLDATNGWACGDLGTIISTSNGGTTWTPQTSPYTSQYNSVQFVNTSTGWIVGKGSVLLKTINGGANWAQQSNQGVDMWGIDMQSTTTGWVCGGFNNTQNSPTLLKTINGTNWTFQTNSGVSSFLGFNDVHFTDANNGWIVGGNGVIRRTTNAGATAWTAQSSGTQYELLGVDFINPSVGYACGRQGIIIATSNGGTSWAAQYSSISSGTLWEIDMVDATTGFAVGDAGLILKYTVYTPSQPIDLLQPNNGAEIFQISTIRYIIWQTQAGITNVKLEYSTTGNAGPWTTIVASTPAATGSYSWTIPNTSSVNCFVRISNTANSSINDISNAAFYILNTPYGIDYSVLTSATVNISPPQIALSWVNDVNALSYSVDKKLPADAGWSNLATLPGTTNNYTDNAVTTGIIYEYRVVKTTPLVTGYGYVYAGINMPAPDTRGTLLLAVNNSFSTYLQPEIDQLTRDLIGDGWKVVQQNFPPATKDTAVKSWVQSEYNKPGANVKSLLLIGHFAIPYSGNFAPDGHAERIGAQPADVYYADVDGAWTDNTVTTTTTGSIYTPNIPNDGRWDASTIPSPAELQVGRIDMYNMTGFALNEADLIKQYLNKNHAFRHKTINPARRAFINTHLDKQLFSTSAVAWRSFSPMLGSSNIGTINTNGCAGNNSCNLFIDSLENRSYLWTYMAGGGSDTSCADPVFTSSQCISRTINTVFMQLYGSYFVEWAKGGVSTTTNHLLRAPLANSAMPLATCWTGGMPRWYFQHMGLGETIGFSVLQSQNNTGIYDPGNATLNGGVHMALMGDPSLRLLSVYPVSNLAVTQVSATLQLNWTASADDNIIGYNIYRADTITGNFIKLNTSIISATNYTDSTPALLTNNVYMVRAVKLETTASGSYQNMSEGIFISSAVNTTFSFTGNGNWSNTTNWTNNLVPPPTLPAGFTIVINPAGNGQCIVDITQHISTGGSLIISSGKNLLIPGSLVIQ